MKPLRFMSFFSGVGMFDLALLRAGYTSVGACEIDAFARKVYADAIGTPAYFPEDITAIVPEEIPDADVWAGGSPCQDFSVAGQRKGLDGNRSSLILHWIALAKVKRPKWIVIENVPGMLSGGGLEDGEGSAGGQDGEGEGAAPGDAGTSWFGTILGALAESGYPNVAWRVLDAQWWGVAQRRRRVFLVAHLGDGADPGEVLFEPEGVRRDLEASSEARKGASRRTREGVAGGGDTASTLQNQSQGRGYRIDAEGAAGGHLVPVPALAFYPHSGLDQKIQHDISPPITIGSGQGANPPGVCYREWPKEIAPTLNAHFGTKQGLEDQHALGGAGLFVPGEAGAVRRLTPLECERLQGLPDGWTCLCGGVTTQKCVCPDGPRYRAIGNGGVTHVVEWIGRRLAEVHGRAP